LVANQNDATGSIRDRFVGMGRGERIAWLRATHTRREPMGEIIDKVKGKVKQAAGKMARDKDLEREGKVDETKGDVKGVAEDVKHAVKDAVKK
jgi:uncharacterized protein YjbJ (UPF0337 family)